ncbi:MFS transporter [Streptomyces chartreusis]|uniref:MFS transporter n=1 Tax=Streptomyces chartreusis TaxID=1969 RepID=UPI003D8C5DB2
MDFSSPGRAGLGAIKDFRLLWISGLCASLGAQMSSIALPLLVLRYTGSPVQAGAVGSVSVAALLITMLPGGALADTVERRRLMQLCNLGSMLAVASLTIAVLMGSAPLALVIPVAAAGAVISSFYGPAALGLLRAAVPESLLHTASSRLQARNAAARLVGPMAGGALFAMNPALPFIAEVVGLLLSTVFLAFVQTRSAPEPATGSAFSKAEFVAGVTYIWRRSYLRTVLLVFGLGMNAAFAAMMFVALATASHGGESGIGGGIIASLTAIGTLAGALLAPRLPTSLRPVVLISGTCWVCAGAAAALQFSDNPFFVGGCCAVSLALGSAAGIGFTTSLLMTAPSNMVGRVQSAAGFVSSLVQPLGPVAGGALLAAYGTQVTYLSLALIFLLCAMSISWAPSVRKEGMDSERGVATREVSEGRSAATD